MKKVQDPLIDDNSNSSPLAQQHERRVGPILNALHESRRKQAARIISSHGHLIDEAASREEPWIQQLKAEADISRKSASESRPAPWRLVARALVAVIILG